MKKKKKPSKKRPIAQKKSPPKETAPLNRDPTAGTAAYLRGQASRLTACAPATGARVRVHLEVEVAPTGKIIKTQITNIEPVPSGIAACVDRAVRALTPPGFDGTAPETFALTIVL